MSAWMNIKHDDDDAKVNMMFEYADQDGDGKLSYGEFLKVMNPPRPEQELQEGDGVGALIGVGEMKAEKNEDEDTVMERKEEDEQRVVTFEDKNISQKENENVQD